MLTALIEINSITDGHRGWDMGSTQLMRAVGFNHSHKSGNKSLVLSLWADLVSDPRSTSVSLWASWLFLSRSYSVDLPGLLLVPVGCEMQFSALLCSLKDPFLLFVNLPGCPEMSSNGTFSKSICENMLQLLDVQLLNQWLQWRQTSLDSWEPPTPKEGISWSLFTFRCKWFPVSKWPR